MSADRSESPSSLPSLSRQKLEPHDDARDVVVWVGERESVVEVDQQKEKDVDSNDDDEVDEVDSPDFCCRGAAAATALFSPPSLTASSSSSSLESPPSPRRVHPSPLNATHPHRLDDAMAPRAAAASLSLSLSYACGGAACAQVVFDDGKSDYHFGRSGGGGGGWPSFSPSVANTNKTTATATPTPTAIATTTTSTTTNSMTTSPRSFKIALLALMVLQNSSVVLIGRHTRGPGHSGKEEDLYVVNHLIVMAELFKLVVSAVFEDIHASGMLWKSVKANIIDRPIDAIKIIVPALLYLVQNSLLYSALSNLSAPLFQVTYQGKLLTTAMVSVLMLNRRYSLKQWFCLVLLGIGVAIVVLGEAEHKEDIGTAAAGKDVNKPEQQQQQNLFFGLVCVLAACVSSALASVYFEKVLKKPTVEAGGAAREPVSMWMRNIQMAFFSVCIGLVQHANLSGPDKEKPWLHGFTGWVYLLLVLQAGGGLLVAAVIKYADNVLKGLATSVSLVFSSLCSMVLFRTRISSQFMFGAAIILGSVYAFSTDAPGKKKADKDDSFKVVEMKHLLPK